MLDKRLWVTGAAVAVTVMTAVVAVSFPREVAAPSRQDAQDIAISGHDRSGPRVQQPRPEYQYIIKEHGGRVAVFVPGRDEPETVLDVLVKHLPAYDQDQMKSGIPVQSYDQLVALLEDYTS